MPPCRAATQLPLHAAAAHVHRQRRAAHDGLHRPREGPPPRWGGPPQAALRELEPKLLEPKWIRSCLGREEREEKEEEEEEKEEKEKGEAEGGTQHKTRCKRGD